MSEKIDATSDILPSGTITFYEACIPPLTAGDYQLTASQQPDIPNAAAPPAYSATQLLTVDGPRFTLQPTDVKMVYPPARQQGAYGETLPHIVLAQRDLPWSRALGGSQATATTPWLALLTVYPASESSLVTAPTQMTVAQVASPGQGIQGPVLGTLSQQTLAQQCLAIDMDTGLFTAIAPQLAELPFLAHARQVDTSAKETTGGVQEGFFSVVVGNRLPDSSSAEPRDSTVFLVSLEGQQDNLPGGSGFPSGVTKVRLVVLASWSFTTRQSAGDFIGLLQALPQRGGVRLLQMPHAEAETTLPEQTYAEQGLELGYVPLLDLSRSGEQTTSWYRGPLSPYPTTRDLGGPYATSDAAMQYDPEHGLFAMSWAAAWQIGRLLALADRSFAQGIIQWRRQAFFQQGQTQADTLLATRLEAPAGTSGPASRRSWHAGLVQGFLRERFGPVLREGVTVPLVTPRSKRLDPERLPGLVAGSRLAAARQAGEDPLQAIASQLFEETP
ncbi:hypothetical protein COCOR_06898 [Corallococcus coralloides DSM 2259]|uniref:Uncharacterized protein n=1 Tax=Corallococcus coralloides (strain ATCC 25202 / DSM 2259 / NBRC 100086 / M2) TaxID=1144275 RepID=H8N2A2_CORCM|nr:hypothetical protein [Corallococcus coralloides]AFE07207.1 hypothetical protein COCOR_06898 [Corallococcus coralloides DSM 2259]